MPLRRSVVVLALAAACLRAAAATPEAVAEIRAASFARLGERVAAAEVHDVEWSGGMVVSIESYDAATGTISARAGRSLMRLPVKTVDERQLARVMDRAAVGDPPDAECCALAAALYRLTGDAERSRLALERAKAQRGGADERYAAWAVKLGLDEPAKPPARAAEPGGEPAPADPPPEAKARGRDRDAPKGPTAPAVKRHPIAKEHPRLFGSRARLQGLAQERPAALKAMLEFAHRPNAGDALELGVPSLSLAYALTGEAALGRRAIDLCLPLIRGPIKVGHTPFGNDLAMCAFAYDGCHDLWTAGERAEFFAYFEKTYDQNVASETYVTANGWYQYKWWGIGLAAYATMHEFPRAGEFLKALETDYTTRAAPALELMGDGGGWAEGHYIAYWLARWLCFCEAARQCEGVDYYAAAPRFYGQRALCSLFDVYPGEQASELNRPVPHGDGGYGDYGGFTEFVLAARRMLCAHYRDDPVHQAVNGYDAKIPLNAIGEYAWWTWLFDDATAPRGDYTRLPLSHLAAGPGDVFMRSSWDADATWVSFRCGDRFNGHQHLDVGHFMVYRRAPLAGDAGVYDGFSSDHAANFYTRTIAHNTLLIFDPAEKFPASIRNFGGAIANDGGQRFPWGPTVAGNNGGVADAPTWQANKALMDTGDLLAFDDQQAYVYAAGDCAKAYAPEKCATCTRQLVFVRPSTLVVFDRVVSRRADQRKYWSINLHGVPPATSQPLVATNGDGRLFIQTLLPADPVVTLHSGPALYAYFGQPAHPPETVPGGASLPVCRVQVSARTGATDETFLHVLTATDATVATVPAYAARTKAGEVALTVGPASIVFTTASIGGSITINGSKKSLAPNLR